jgi:prevent-host-death family protein
MPIIRPVSDLRNNFNEISNLCHEHTESVYLTKNGKGDMVVMSIAKYEEQLRRLELYSKILEAETEAKNSDTRHSHEDVMSMIRGIVGD